MLSLLRLNYAIPFSVIITLVVFFLSAFSESTLDTFIIIGEWLHARTPINIFALDYGRSLMIFYATLGISLFAIGYLLAPLMHKVVGKYLFYRENES